MSKCSANRERKPSNLGVLNAKRTCSPRRHRAFVSDMSAFLLSNPPLERQLLVSHFLNQNHRFRPEGRPEGGRREKEAADALLAERVAQPARRDAHQHRRPAHHPLEKREPDQVRPRSRCLSTALHIFLTQAFVGKRFAQIRRPERHVRLSPVCSVFLLLVTAKGYKKNTRQSGKTEDATSEVRTGAIDPNSTPKFDHLRSDLGPLSIKRA